MRAAAALFSLALAGLSVVRPAAAAGPTPLSPEGFAAHPAAQVEAGWLLFYDPVLSGGRTVACATCHHPRFATGDGVSLGLGDGGVGLGPERRPDPANPPEQRIPRNAPPLFNLGHAAVAILFHDGRIEVDPGRPSGLRTPLDDEMAVGFSGLLSAQTMFPVLSPDEMAGHYQENDVAKAVRQGRITGPGGAWDVIARRVDAIPAYRAIFARFDDAVAAGAAVDFIAISDAVAAFMAVEWRADDTPYDRALRGGPALPALAARGQALFFGAAGCAECHGGPLLSDQRFHAMAAPQLGPGKAARFETHRRDDGRMRVTGDPADAFAFRTPMLRNVARTGPWGHAGGHSDLAAFLRDHAAPRAALDAYVPQATLPALPGAEDWTIMDDAEARAALKAAYRGEDLALSEETLAALLAFLAALTDETSLAGRLGVPEAVPSGLPVDR